MHTIKITPNLLFEYRCRGLQAGNLSDCRIESNRKNRFGSDNRIESNRNFFLPELECSTSLATFSTLSCSVEANNNAVSSSPSSANPRQKSSPFSLAASYTIVSALEGALGSVGCVRRRCLYMASLLVPNLVTFLLF